MSRNGTNGKRRTGSKLAARRQWNLRKLRPAVQTLEPRTLLSTWYVNSANTGSVDGMSAETGFPTMQDGISAASPGDSVLVESGNGYNESDTVDVPDLTIEADSGQSPVLDGSNPSFQGSAGFSIQAFDVTISGFTIQNFSGSSAVNVQSGASLTLTNDVLQGNSSYSSGGAVFNDAASVTLINCTVSGNFASYSGGGLYSIYGSNDLIDCFVSGNTSGYFGGGISNKNSTTTLSGVTVSGNSAVIGGGVYSSGFLTVQFSNFFSNQGSLFGGGLANAGDLDLLDSGFTDNSAGNTGGGLLNDQGGEGSISGCHFSGNRAGFFGFEGVRGGGGIAISSGVLSIANTTLDDNSSATAGGGLLTLFGGAFMTNCTLSQNSAVGSGGGLFNDNTAQLTDCTLSGNSAANGGGVYNIGGMSGAYIDGSAALLDCTLSGNTATNSGGGVFNDGGAYHFGEANNGVTTLTNCTVSGNSASNGGGVYNTSGVNTGTITVLDSTVSGNSASVGGGLENVSATVTIGNTIVAQNTATASAPDASGSFASQGNNLVGATDGSSGWLSSDLTGTTLQLLNPLLAPLNNYGGSTQTMALLPGSPAIDAGNNALVPPGVTTDQRGFDRIVNGIVDIGAFESSGFTISMTSGSEQSAGVLTAFSSSLVVTVTPNLASDPVAGGVVTFTPPASGASAILSTSLATIGATGTASVTAAADGLVGSYTVSATARGIATPAGFSLTNTPLILVLSPSAPGALSLSGNASISSSGAVYVDSSSSSALSASGNSQVKAAAIEVVGGVKSSGNARLSPAPVTGAASLAAASLPPPSSSGLTNYGALSLGGHASAIIQPGIYSEIDVSGSAKLTMTSGLYIIEGGGFSISGTASVFGSGVTIVNGGSKYPSVGGSYGAITLRSMGALSLSPATSGLYAGIIFFQPADNTIAISVSSIAMGVTGTIYAPASQLSLSGNAMLDASLIVEKLAITGNASAARVSSAGSAGTVSAQVVLSRGTATPTSTIAPAVVFDQTAPNTTPFPMKIKLTGGFGSIAGSLSLPVVSMPAVGSVGNLVPQPTTGISQPGSLFALESIMAADTFNLKNRSKGLS
jgi:hypothetical protein